MKEATATREPETVGELVDALPAIRPPSQPLAPVTPMQMLQIAVEKGADLAMLDKLMTLQERWEANEARKAYVSSLSAFKADPPRIVKNKSVSFQSERTKQLTEYDHATLDQVCAVVGGALSKHGLSHRWEVDQGEGGLISVTCVLMHALGHSERVTLRAGADQTGGKNNIQAVGSTVTYLERYTLLAITGLAATDQDDDSLSGGAAETITAEQKEELVSLMKETGADTKAFLKYLGVASLDEIRADKFGDAKAALARKKERTAQ